MATANPTSCGRTPTAKPRSGWWTAPPQPPKCWSELIRAPPGISTPPP